MGWPVKEKSVVYAIRCTENSKVYIGRTQNLERRLKEHAAELRKCAKLRTGASGRELSEFQRDYNRYGEEAFECYLLEENISPEDIQSREAAWIEEYRATDPVYGYNKKSEQLAHGFANVKRGLPPKPETLDAYAMYEMLTPANREIVIAEIKRLLREQEREERRK